MVRKKRTALCLPPKSKLRWGGMDHPTLRDTDIGGDICTAWGKLRVLTELSFSVPSRQEGEAQRLHQRNIARGCAFPSVTTYWTPFV